MHFGAAPHQCSGDAFGTSRNVFEEHCAHQLHKDLSAVPRLNLSVNDQWPK